MGSQLFKLIWSLLRGGLFIKGHALVKPVYRELVTTYGFTTVQANLVSIERWSLYKGTCFSETCL